MTLNRDQIVSAALNLMRSGGLEAVSMRKLALSLNVQGATLYYHFASKRELQDQMTESLLKPTWRGAREGERWQDWIFEVNVRMRKTLLSCPDSARMAAGAKPTGTDESRHLVNLAYQSLISAGFTFEQATYVRVSCYRFTIGYVLDEHGALESGRRPPVDNPDAAFDFGLSALIKGFEMHCAAKPGELRSRLTGSADQ